MGLDITWYRGIRPAPEAELDEDGYPVDWNAYVKVTPQVSFPERGADIAPGVYAAADKGDFRAGSYSGYNDWREQLAEMAGYRALEHEGPRHRHSAGAWESEGGPFFELIHFTDCDGFIGTEVSKKLAADFAEHQPRADAIGGWFAEKYLQWRNAFEQAQHGGFVDFH